MASLKGLQKVAPKWDDFLPTHRKRNGISEFSKLGEF